MGAPETSGKERTRSKDGEVGGESSWQRQASIRQDAASRSEVMNACCLRTDGVMIGGKLTLSCWSQRRSMLPTGGLVPDRVAPLKPRPSGPGASR